MQSTDNRCAVPDTSDDVGPLAYPPASPVVSVDRDNAVVQRPLHLHSHPEPMLSWSATATVLGTVSGRDWLIPPGYGLWVPGGVEHSGSVLHSGEIVTVTFAPGARSPAWTDTTAFVVGPLLGAIFTHLEHAAPEDDARPAAEELMFRLMEPLPERHIRITVPVDPRAKLVAERLIAHPGDRRELTAWADLVHTSVRTLARLFTAETGLSFSVWRTHVRMRAAIPGLVRGDAVNVVARTVGYRRASTFIAAFRRVTGSTPGSYQSGRRQG